MVCTPGGTNATLVALNKRTGAVIWKCAVPEGSDASYSSAVIAEFSGVKQYVQFLASGLVVHGYATGRLPLCAAWLLGFVGQGAVRSLLFGIPWNVPLMPMTSAAFILFTLYMIPDPATTPLDAKRQVAYGLGLAAVYGILISAHIVFGLFLALFIMSALRGLGLAWSGRSRTASAPVLAG